MLHANHTGDKCSNNHQPATSLLAGDQVRCSVWSQGAAKRAMQTQQAPRTRKRSRTWVDAQTESGQTPGERTAFSRPARFWDNLSTIPLTSAALQELDNRNFKIDSSLCRSKRRRSESPAAQAAAVPCCSRDSPEIKRFARHGGPDLRDIGGLLQMSSSQLLGRRKRPQSSSRTPRSQSSKTSTTRSTKSTGPYDRAFQQHLIDHNMLPDEYEYPDGTTPPAPANMGEILDALSRSRASLSPSRFTADDFRTFKRADTHAHKERDVTVNVIPIIEGNVEDSKCTAGEIPFTNLDPLTDGTLVPANPDKYYGARPEQLKRIVREELNGRIVPSTQHDLPIAPNYFLQVKGPDGTPAVARRQAWHDSIIGARGIDGLQSYKAPSPMFDNKAYTLASVYQGGQLKMYASQPIPPREAGGPPGYVMTQLKAYALTSDVEAFRIGAAAYRNGRDWAKSKRDQAIKHANAVAKEHLARVSKLPCSVAESSSVAETLDVTSQETATPGSQTSDESEGATEDLNARRPAKRRSPEKRDAGEIKL